jgi:hypothetical protein
MEEWCQRHGRVVPAPGFLCKTCFFCSKTAIFGVEMVTFGVEMVTFGAGYRDFWCV